MKLKPETVNRTFAEFATMFDVPARIGTKAKMQAYLKITHRELSKYFDEESFHKGTSFVYANAKYFPTVANFFEFGKTSSGTDADGRKVTGQYDWQEVNRKDAERAKERAETKPYEYEKIKENVG